MKHVRDTLCIGALLSAILLLTGCSPPVVLPAATDTNVDEDAFWDSLPLPEDAEIARVIEPFDVGFATEMIEPELFDFYARWLSQNGWVHQAPTEAMITPPHQRWRKDDQMLLIELQAFDDQGRTVGWLRLESDATE